MHLKRLSCRKSHKEEKKTGSSEELSVSVYLTMFFSNKMMKGLLIVCPQIETAGAVKHYERRQRAYLSM